MTERLTIEIRIHPARNMEAHSRAKEPHFGAIEIESGYMEDHTEARQAIYCNKMLEH